MNDRKSHFVYNPPKSNSMGHSVRDKNLPRALNNTINAIVKNFDVKPDEDLNVNIYFNEHDDAGAIESTIKFMTEQLGNYDGRWNNNMEQRNTIHWNVQGISIKDLIEIIEENRINKNLLPWKNFWISTHYSDQQSLFSLSIERNTLFVRLSITIPYDITDDRAYKLIKSFNNDLPFKLGNKHFRIFGPKNNRVSNWKLDTETQQLINNCLIK